MKRKHKYILVLLITIVIISLLLIKGCGYENGEKTTKTETRNIPVVLVATPQQHPFNASLQITGTAKPNQSVKLFAMTSGYLKQLRADIGSFVKEGQVLAVLENPDLYREKERLQAELKEKSALYFRLKNNREQTMVGADVKAKKALYDRLKSIYEKTPQLTSIADVEKAEADYKRASAQATDELDINASAYQAANARLKNINMQISYLWIKAPFSGVITNRFADKGALIQNGLNNNSSMPLFELQDLQPIRLQVDIPETDVVLINNSTMTQITFPELPNSRYSTTVSRVAYSVDETKTMKVEIDLPNKDLKIRPGMYAKVDIQRSGHKEALSVPNEAVGNIKGQSFIYVVQNGKAKKADVKTGIRDEKFTELLDAPLKKTDMVIVQGKELVSDGAVVQTKQFINQ